MEKFANCRQRLENKASIARLAQCKENVHSTCAPEYPVVKDRWTGLPYEATHIERRGSQRLCFLMLYTVNKKGFPFFLII